MPTKLYLNGTVVDYATPPCKGENFKNRSNSISFFGYPLKKTSPDFRHFRINFKNRMLLTDCALIQSYIARQYNDLNHCFLTATYSTDQKHKYLSTENRDITRFCDKLTRKYPKQFTYVWVREYTKAGFPHYHITATMPRIPIAELNSLWCKCRNFDSANGLSSAKFFNKSTGKYYNKMIINDSLQVVKYISKYITKSNKSLTEDQKNYLKINGLKSNGRVWSASNFLKKYAKPVFLPSHHSFTHNSYYNPNLNKIERDYSTIYFLDHRRIEKVYKDLTEYYSEKTEI